MATKRVAANSKTVSGLRVSARLSKTTIQRGSKATVTVKVTRTARSSNKRVAAKGAKVTVQFRADSSQSWITLATKRANKTGRAKVKVGPQASGKIRVKATLRGERKTSKSIRLTVARPNTKSGGSASTSSGNKAVGSSLSSGRSLTTSQYLASPSGKYQLRLSATQLAVVRVADGKVTWSTKLEGAGSAVMQGDGNFVIYKQGKALWSSNTGGFKNSQLRLQDDSNLVIYQNGRAVWSSNGGYRGHILDQGQSLNTSGWLRSPNGQYAMYMQGDGNLVNYKDGKATWSSGTGGTNADTAVMQGDGNFVIYKQGKALWSSNTGGNSGATLYLQDDGNLVIYKNGVALWASRGASSDSGGANGGYPDFDATPCGQWMWCKGGSYYHPTRRFAYRNCTDFVSWKIGRNWGDIQSGNSGHAIAWRQGWINRGRTVSSTPKVGAVAWWGTSYSTYGHVAYVLKVNANGSVKVAEYNYATTGQYGERDNVRAESYLY